MSIDKVFERALDELSELAPKAPAIVLGAMRTDEDDRVTYPVVVGCRGLDQLNGDAMELAEMILSSLRSIRSLCRSVCGNEEGDSLFGFVASKAMTMAVADSLEQQDDTVVDYKEWSRVTGDSIKKAKDEGGKISIDRLMEDWEEFLK